MVGIEIATQSWGQVTDGENHPMAGQVLELKNLDGTNAAVYQDRGCTILLAGDIETDADGLWPGFAPAGTYELTEPVDETARYVEAVSGADLRSLETGRVPGAVGDGVADDITALQVAVDAPAPNGKRVTLGDFSYGISSPLKIKVSSTSLVGNHNPFWWADPGTIPWRPTSQIKALPGFTGAALILFEDMEESDPDLLQQVWACMLSGIQLSGEGIATSGLILSGQQADHVIRDVEVSHCTGDGVVLRDYTRVGAGAGLYFPQNLHIENLRSHHNGGRGVVENRCHDSVFIGCYTHKNSGDGWYMNKGGVNNYTVCKSEHNGANGFHTQSGVSDYYSRTFTGCYSDRSNYHGWLFEHGSDKPTILNGCGASRDGRNGGAGGGSYAGFACIGTALQKVGPMIFNAMTSSVMNADDGSEEASPQIGIRYEHCRSLYIDGMPWGRVNAVQDFVLGSNGVVHITPGTIFTYGLPAEFTPFDSMVRTLNLKPTVYKDFKVQGMPGEAAEVRISADGDGANNIARLLLERDDAVGDDYWELALAEDGRLVIARGLAGVYSFPLTLTTSEVQVELPLRFPELASDPAAPPPNYVSLYALDDGAGNTQLKARFNTGAPVVVAVEP